MSEPKRILYIEDNITYSMLVQNKLQKFDFIVDIANSGKKGIKLYKSNNYDFILLDQKLPGMDGLEILKILCNQNFLPPPIVMLTGTGSEQLAVNAMKIGASDYIVKDVDGDHIDKLPKIIERTINTHKLVKEKKLAEKELKRINKKLLKEIEYRKSAEAAMRRAKEEADAANKAKSKFLANMSHDIRTPMNAILGMAEMLWESPLNHEQQQYVQIFRTAGENLLNLINDILDLSKVEAGYFELDKTSFNLMELIEKIGDIMALKAHAKNLDLSCYLWPDVPNYIIGDPERIQQILVNLLNNAIKFTQEGEIFCEIKFNKLHQNNKVELLFSVKDTGIGISNENQKKIFQSFVQADSSTTRKYGGTGLGLTICQHLVEMMEGIIWIESEIEKGTCFYFTACFDLDTEPVEKPLPVDLKNLKVLIVDDNATSRFILNKILSKYGADITEVANGEQCLEAIIAADADNPFQLILLDGKMPGIDGFETAQRIKQQFGDLSQTVMLLTSEHRIKNIAKVKKFGIQSYLIKPVKHDDLKNAISTALGRTKQVETKTLQRQKVDLITDAKPLNILLVEDIMANQQVVKAYLENTSYNLDIAENGAIGVEKHLANNYDMIFMDIEMPVMDGFEATRTIRQWEKEKDLKPTPIIALTAHALKGYNIKSLEAGCTNYMTKPFKRISLLETIDKYQNGIIEEPDKIDINRSEKAEKKLKLNVLLAEDLPINQKVFTLTLKNIADKIDIAENGKIAVEKFITGKYDIVFMDVEMPVMNGLKASAKIREWEKEKDLKPTPIIALTAHELKDVSLKKELEKQDLSYLIKPYNKKILIEIIEKNTDYKYIGENK
ncbi:two-component system, sensor histidine kinase and response regulator [Candidatus Magnetomoraceae bacterium gMMP-15]